MTPILKPDHTGDAHFDPHLYSREVPSSESLEQVKNRINQAKAKDDEAHKRFDRVYSLLTPAERDELLKITDATERREYITRKYSKLTGQIES
jgi:hypothetical protein